MRKPTIRLENVSRNPDGSHTAHIRIGGDVFEGPTRSTEADAKYAGLRQVIGICDMLAAELFAATERTTR